MHLNDFKSLLVVDQQTQNKKLMLSDRFSNFGGIQLHFQSQMKEKYSNKNG